MRTGRRGNGSQGFTLIELLIVVIIVGILAASAVPLYLSQTKRAKTVEAVAGLGAIRNEQTAYYAERQAYLAVEPGNIANPPGTESPGLGLDFSDNAYFGNHCFSVALDETYGYVATADGGAEGNSAPRASEVADIVVQTRGKGGEVRLSYDGGETHSAWR